MTDYIVLSESKELGMSRQPLWTPGGHPYITQDIGNAENTAKGFLETFKAARDITAEVVELDENKNPTRTIKKYQLGEDGNVMETCVASA